MALIHCPECGNTISDKAKQCPNCGSPITTLSTQNQSANKSLIIILGLIALLLLAAIAIFFAYQAGKSNQDKTETTIVKTDTVVMPVAQGPKPAKRTFSEPAPRGPMAYFVVISSTTSLQEAQNKASSFGGLVVKGYAKGATRYRVCMGAYNTRQEAQAYLYDAKESFTSHAWILPEHMGAIVYP